MKTLTANQLALYYNSLCTYRYGDSTYEGFKVSHAMRETFPEFIKPILRPLSDITEEEKMDLALKMGIAYDKIDSLCKGLTEYLSINQSAEILNHLRGLNADCDHWIESGLAIDKTLQPVTPLK